jgi:hemoglobin
VNVEELDVYSIVGESGITRLVAAFYRRVPQDDILGPMYPAHDLAGSERRLRDFLIYRLGGPPHYIEERGHPRLRIRHAPFHIDQAARERWMHLMTEALEESAFPPPADRFLRAFLGEMATFLINRAAPGAL